MKKISHTKKMRGARAYRRGHRAEKWVAWLLRFKAYHILEQCYRTPAGEIDLIMQRGNTLIFMEVKQRQTMEALHVSLSGVQQRRIINAAELYCAKHPHHAGLDIRFDVMWVRPWRWPVQIKNAWQANV